MPTITVTIDDTHEGYALYGELICRYGVDATDFDLNGGYTLGDYQADLDAISGVSDLMRGRTPEADPTPPRPLLIEDIDCTHPGCPGRPGQYCGTPNVDYRGQFTHQTRLQAFDAAGGNR